MNIKLSEYNPLDFLQNDSEVAAYLNDAYLDADPRVFLIALGHIAKAKGMSYVAEKSGLNRESLYKALSGNTQPRWDTVQRVMKSLDIHIQAVAHS